MKENHQQLCETKWSIACSLNTISSFLTLIQMLSEFFSLPFCLNNFTHVYEDREPSIPVCILRLCISYDMHFPIIEASKIHIRSIVAISVFLLFQYTALLMWAFGVQVVLSTFIFIKKKEVWKDHPFI